MGYALLGDVLAAGVSSTLLMQAMYWICKNSYQVPEQGQGCVHDAVVECHKCPTSPVYSLGSG
jgi:hypothetical protein